MPAFSKLAVVAPCLAQAVSLRKGASLAPGFVDTAPQPVMAKAFHKDPNWDEKTVQQDHPHPDSATYHNDYPKDDRPNVTGDESWTHVAVPQSEAGPSKHTAPWYRSECKKINEHCIFIRDHRLSSTRADIEYFENEYLRLLRIYDGMKADHAAEKYDVEELKKQIAKAEMIVKEYAHCPPQLEAAKDKLASLEVIEDRTPNDIEAECDVEKVVVEKERCVDKLRDAEDLLAAHKASLPGEKSEVVTAFNKLPRQEERVAAAKARWEVIRNRGVEPSVHALELGCRRERDELMSTLTNDVDGLYQIYLREKAERDGFKEKHAEEKDEAKAQEEDVAEAKAEVEKAEATVRKLAHCPPELEAAEARLVSLEAIADKTPSDIDEECEAEKKVVKARACVDELRAAEDRLLYHDGVHGAENTRLSAEETQAAHAASFVPPQTEKTAAAKAAWLAAKALYESSECKLDPSLEL